MKPAVRKILLVAVVLGIAGTLLVLRPWADSDTSSNLLYGNVDLREVQLGFRTSGRLETMTVDEGDTVAPGDVLATLDPEPAREALAGADAKLAQAKAQLAALRAGARPQEIAQAQARVRGARATFTNAQAEAAREESLLRTQSTSPRTVDTARAARDSAAAALESAEEALALLQAGARAEDIMASEAAVAVAASQRAQAATTVSDTNLVAPSPGIVFTRAREPGSFVQAGQTVYAIALTESVYVRAYVDEPRLGFVAPGSRVTIQTDSTTRNYTGQIGFVSPQAEFTPKSVQTPELRTDLVYRLRIIVTDADEGLRQGMPVTIMLPTETLQGAAGEHPDANNEAGKPKAET